MIKRMSHKFQNPSVNMICIFIHTKLFTKNGFPKTKNFIHIVKLEVFKAVTMKNGVFWDVMTCGSSKNRRFGGT
jgi:hypothetical protein